MKLPTGDKRGYILGQMTNCCQSINNAGEKSVIDGMTRANNGFYVLIKANTKKKFNPENIDWKRFEAEGHRIVGQGYLWRSKANNLVFDSWENLRPEVHDKIIPKALSKFAEKAIKEDSTISRIMIGLGGKTPKEGFIKAPAVDIVLEGHHYRDSYTQGLVYENPVLTKKREELRNKIRKEIGIDNIQVNNIISIRQSDILLNLDFNIFNKIYSSQNYYEIQTHTIALQGPEAYITLFVESGIEKFQALISKDAREAYKTGEVKVSDLKDLELDEFRLLTSDNVLKAYDTGKVRFSDLRGLEPEKIKLLTSWDAIETYQIGEVKASDLRGLEPEKIKLLTSWTAVEAYQTGEIKVSDLKDLEPEKIKLLASWTAVEAYQTGQVKVSDLNADTILGIWQNLLRTFAKHLCKETNFNYVFSENDIKKIKLLTSNQARRAYQTGQVRISDLKDLEPEKIKLLASWTAVEAYQTGEVKASDLRDLEPEKIKLLTSKHAIEAYKTGEVKTSDLRDLGIKKFRLLVCKEAIEAYKTGQVKFSDLKDLETTKLLLLTSKGAIKVYNTAQVNASGLKDLEPKLVQQLISPEAVTEYTNGMSFKKLLEKIISQNSMDIQEEKKSFSDTVRKTNISGFLMRY